MASRSSDERSGTSEASMEGSVERSTPEGSPRPKPAASAADQRRARHRKVVKHSYYRKLDKLQSLRSDVQQLEQQFAAIVTRHQIQQQTVARPVFSVTTTYGGDISADAHTFGPPRPAMRQVPCEELMGLYMRATLRKEALMRGQEQLQRQVDAHAEFERKLNRFAEEQIKAMEREPPFRVENHTNGTPPNAPRISIEPLTSAECLEVASGAYREIRAFLSKNAFLTSGVSAFGWRDRRTLKDGKLMFSLKKFHHGMDADKLARRAWEACSQRLRQFYPSSMDMTHYTVQQVDENNTVLYRVMVSPDRRFATKALMLVSHFHTETGGAMIIRSLDPSRIRAHKPEAATTRKRGRRGEIRSSEEDEQTSTTISPLTRDQWVNVFTWILFDRAGSEGEHCTMDFGGIVPHNTVVGSEVWMMEVLPIALRLESELIAPLFHVARN